MRFYVDGKEVSEAEYVSTPKGSKCMAKVNIDSAAEIAAREEALKATKCKVCGR